jgi:hypothetical protein
MVGMRAKLPISPLEGEMAGRPEGGVKEYKPDSRCRTTAPP